MDLLFLFVVVFLLLLAVFDLSVGVSNDAVNFLNSALGSRAASFKRVLLVAAIGVFVGAAMSNGMMDIARHGIFRPEHFSFYELLCVFMAVMVTDIILLDVFNTLGMPTSTTVSMVFELLGASFVVAVIKIYSTAGGLGLAELLNTEKALSVILGIFLSVAIAFVFGTVVQFITRAIFSFNFKKGLRWKIGLFGGICATLIVYFLLIKGMKDLTFMTHDVKDWIANNTSLVLLSCFLGFSLLMQLLHTMRVNVLKVIVLMGTFALAMAFAGNDLVNFIGVPLTGLAAFQDYAANGAGDPHSFMMESLQGSANTPVYFLLSAGIIMVIALSTSKKTRHVSKTEIGLGSQSAGDEMFGSSRIARRMVRWTLTAIAWVQAVTPKPVRAWFARRFDIGELTLEQGAAFDLVRGSVNLVLAGALIALGTSLKLPLSTTFVTFMVAMGTSLSDQAWSRESAVFRITGVISVIGGWFLTAGAAFCGAGLMVCIMYWGGHWAMLALAALTVVLIIRSNQRFRERPAADADDTLFHAILATSDKSRVWPMLLTYVSRQQAQFLALASGVYANLTQAFLSEDLKTLSKADTKLGRQKALLKGARRRETLCLRQVEHETAIEKNAWFHITGNCCMSILYNLRRIDEVCREHVENNFLPLPAEFREEYLSLRAQTASLLSDTHALMQSTISSLPLSAGPLDDVELAQMVTAEEQSRADEGVSALPASKTSATELAANSTLISAKSIADLRQRCTKVKDQISVSNQRLHRTLHTDDAQTMTVVYVYLGVLQETQEIVSTLRKYLRAYAKLVDSNYTSMQL